MGYDFGGWATRVNIKCGDGRVIRKDAFIDNDGQVVPLVWGHEHDDPAKVLGHALLENRDDGVYAYCSFNDSEAGQNAKHLVKHGDVKSLSIYANQLKQKGSEVLHGIIREVSLVLAGANPGAYIDTVLEHGDNGVRDDAWIYSGEEESAIVVAHSDDDEEEIKMADNTRKKTVDDEDSGETVADVFNTFTEKQKKVVYALVGQALEDKGGGDEDEEDEKMGMKHNVFETDERQGNFLSHDDMQKIMRDAKRCGSLREAVHENMESGVLAHSFDLTGMEAAPGASGNYGFPQNASPYGVSSTYNDVNMLFPDYRTLNNPPDWLSREMGWVKTVMNGVHHTPFSRIKSVFANITEDEARAKGYIKGHQKREEVFTTLRRTTDPQTIYKKQKMDRDDIVDITDFDVVAWIKAEMRVMLDEEIARAILIGDGRVSDSEDKIQESHIRPIAKDVPLFNITHKVNVAHGADSAVQAKALINESIRARKNYKGSGNPTFFTTEDWLTEMLLLEDGIGHKLYRTEAELATALRCKSIVTVEPMENQTITTGSGNSAETLPLIGVFVNLADYNVGADKGGEVNLFDDFDIDYNQYKYLIETRFSGALIKPFSAITMLLKEAAA